MIKSEFALPLIQYSCYQVDSLKLILESNFENKMLSQLIRYFWQRNKMRLSALYPLPSLKNQLNFNLVQCKNSVIIALFRCVDMIRSEFVAHLN